MENVWLLQLDGASAQSEWATSEILKDALTGRPNLAIATGRQDRPI